MAPRFGVGVDRGVAREAGGAQRHSKRWEPRGQRALCRRKGPRTECFFAET